MLVFYNVDMDAIEEMKKIANDLPADIEKVMLRVGQPTATGSYTLFAMVTSELYTTAFKTTDFTVKERGAVASFFSRATSAASDLFDAVIEYPWFASDSYYYTKNYYICEWDSKPDDSAFSRLNYFRGEFNGHYYCLVNVPNSWNNAKYNCEQNGGYMVSVNSAEEQAAIEAMLRESGIKGERWIGAQFTDNAWGWLNGSPFEYTNWATNNPSGDGTNAFMRFGALTGGDGAWSNEKLDKAFYICEWDEEPENPSFIEHKADLVIPEEINGLPVTAIADNAFKDKDYITSIKLPDTLKSIGQNAFTGTKITEITIPKSVTEFRGTYNYNCSPFYNAAELRKVTFADGTKNIPNGALQYCTQIIEIVLPEGLETIGDNAFYETGITSIDLPSGLTTIGSIALGAKIEEITIPNTVTSMDSVFASSETLRTVIFEDGIKTIPKGALQGCHYVSNVVIPDSVTTIEDYAFSECYNLQTINIPDGVTTIGNSVFQNNEYQMDYYGGTGLTEITLPESIESLGFGVFGGCKNLKKANIPSKIKEIPAAMFYQCKSLEEITIPDDTIAIGEGAFTLCEKLNNIVIPETVTSIGMAAFAGCSSFTEITLPSGLTEISDGLLQGCINLPHVDIPEGVTRIGDYAFAMCTSFTEFEFPEGVTEIGAGTFYGCTGFTEFNIPENITSIGDEAFSGCSNLTGIDIPEAVTSIGSQAFAGCSLITEITLPTKLEILGKSVFEGTGITEITIPKTVTTMSAEDQNSYPYVPKSALYGAEQLKKVVFEDGTEKLPNYALAECSSITELVIPSTVTAIGDYAFKNNTSITEIPITEGITSIGNGAFYGCTGLTKANIISASNAKIGSQAFSRCTGLTEVNIPEGITEIGSNAFYGCTGLTNIVIPKSVTLIGSYAFKDCTNLKEVEIYGGQTIKSGAFYGGKFTKFVLTSNVKTIEGATFGRSSSFSNGVIFYGSQSQWNNIDIDMYDNEPFVFATKEYIHTHEYGDWVVTVKPTCTTDGEQVKTCTTCSEQIKEAVPKLGHEYGDWEVTVEPSCSAEGERAKTCIRCPDQIKESIPKLDHTFGEWVVTVEPSCTAEGQKVRTCLFCDAQETEILPMIEHDYDREVVPPTYFEQGYTIFTCKSCGHTFNDEYIDPLERVELSEADVSLEYDTVFYEGKPLTPKVKLSYNGEELDAAQELNVTYADNNKVGIATVTIEGVNRFKGTVTRTFLITYEKLPAKIESVFAASEIGQISISWGKSAETETNRYNIYRKEAESDTWQLLTTINGRDILSYTDKSVEKGKTYNYYVTGVGLYGAESEPSEFVVATSLVDVDAPEILKMNPDAKSVLRGNATISVKVTDNVKAVKTAYWYSVDNGETWVQIGESTAADFRITFDTSSLTNEAVKIKAVSYDAEGNASKEFINVYSLDNIAPDKVTGLKGEALSSKITLSWNDVKANDAASFILQKKQGENWVEVARNITTLGYTVTGLAADTDYTYRVACIDRHSNIGEFSDPITVRTSSDDTAPVITSQGPQSARYNKSVTYYATAKDDCDIAKIEIQISTDLENWNTVNTKTYTDRNFSQTYRYTVDLSGYAEGSIYVRALATDYSGNVSNSDEYAPYSEYIVDRTAPESPAGVAAAGNDGYITVSWNMGSEADVDKYYLYRADSLNGEYKQIASGLTSVNYHDRNVDRNKTYFYKVCVNDTCGNMSGFSDIVSAMMSDDTQKPQITGISKTPDQKLSSSAHTIKIGASDNNKLSSVVVEYSTSKDTTYKKLVEENNLNIDSKTWDVTVPIDGLEHNDVIFVRAYVVDVTGRRSDTVTAKYTFDAIPAKVNNFTAEIEGKKVYLNWEGNGETDLAGFKVYRSTDGENFSLIGSRGPRGDAKYSFVDTITANESATYFYKVEAFDRLQNTSSVIETVVYKYEYVNSAPEVNMNVPEYMIKGVEEVFDASKSHDDVAVVGYHWDFGDGTTSDEMTPVKKYDNVGTYNVKLSVTDNEGLVTTAEKTIEVKEREALGTLNVRVVDENNHSLSNVPVYFDLGSETQKIVYTDSTGKASLKMLNGSHVIGMYADGYLPVKKETVVLANAERTVTLTTVKEEIVVGEFEIKRMTFEEIQAAGIDVYDPANQNVYSASVQFSYGKTSPPVTVDYIRNDSGLIDYKIKDANGRETDTYTDSNGGKHKVSDIKVIPGKEGGKDIVAVLDVPASASYLKEFFDVKLHIINNASTDFALVDNEISLTIPNGMTLMTSISGNYQKSPVADIDYIGGQRAVTVAWVLRGDDAGEYNLSADFNGILSLFNEPVSARFETKEPIKVYGVEGVSFRILTSDKIYNDTLYFNVEFENQRDVDIYMPSIGLTDKIDNITESVLFNSDSSKTSKAHLMNVYTQNVVQNSQGKTTEGQKNFISLTYDKNGKATTGIDTLAPGQKIVYEYVAYNATNYNEGDTTFFVDAAIDEFDGAFKNVETGTFHCPIYDFDNYTEKLDNILASSDTEVTKALDYVLSDDNYYYEQESKASADTVLKALDNMIYHAGEEKYGTLQLLLNGNLSVLTHEDEKQLIEEVLLTILTDSDVNTRVNNLMQIKTEKAVRSLIEAIAGNLPANASVNARGIGDIEKVISNYKSYALTLRRDGEKAFYTRLKDDLVSNAIGIDFSDKTTDEYFEALGIKKDSLLKLWFDSPFSNDELVSQLDETGRQAYIAAMLKTECNYEYVSFVLDEIITYIEDVDFAEMLLYTFSKIFPGANNLLEGITGGQTKELVLGVAKDLKKKLNEDFNTRRTLLVESCKDKGKEAFSSAITGFVSKALGSGVYEIASAVFNIIDTISGAGTYYRQQDAICIYDVMCEIFVHSFNTRRNIERSEQDDLFTMAVLKNICELRIAGEARYRSYMYEYTYGVYWAKIDESTVINKINSILNTNYKSMDQWSDNVVTNVTKARDILFNVEATSPIVIPNAPYVSLDYDNLCTYEKFSSDYEYCFADGVWHKCDGGPIEFEVSEVPSVMRVRKSAGLNSYAGMITTVDIFARKEMNERIKVKFDGVNYFLENLSPMYDYTVFFIDENGSTVNFAEPAHASGSDSPAKISGYGKYPNIKIMRTPNYALKEITSVAAVLPVDFKQPLNLTIDGSGSVSQTSPTGKYFNGESIDLIAEPNTGETFEGWYIDGKKVSSDKYYVAEMADGLNITAKFTGAKIQNIEVEQAPAKLSYYEGESLDTNGMKVKVNYEGGTSVYTEQYTAYFTTNTVGQSSVVVDYGGHKASFAVTISHDLTDWQTTSEPTLFDEGISVKRCRSCGQIIETKILPMLVDESGIVIDSEGRMISHIPDTLFSSEALVKHYRDLGCRVKVLNSEANDSTNVMTGGYVMYAGQKYSSVIFGDVTGEGEIDIFDTASMLDHVNGREDLDGVYKKAGLIVNEDEIDIFDTAAVLDYVNGKADLNVYKVRGY